MEHLATMANPPRPSQCFVAAVKVGSPFKLKRALGRSWGPGMPAPARALHWLPQLGPPCPENGAKECSNDPCGTKP